MQCSFALSYSHLWPVWIDNIFPHYLRFSKKRKVIKHEKSVLRFSVQSLFETFLILRRTEREMIKTATWSSSTVPVILVRF